MAAPFATPWPRSEAPTTLRCAEDDRDLDQLLRIYIVDATGSETRCDRPSAGNHMTRPDSVRAGLETVDQQHSGRDGGRKSRCSRDCPVARPTDEIANELDIKHFCEVGQRAREHNKTPLFVGRFEGKPARFRELCNPLEIRGMSKIQHDPS
jgi:hypothetical protein